VGADGRLAWASGEENVRQAIRILLLTEQGERLMREEFGCGLRSFLFEPNTPTVRQLIRERIQQAIKRWEPRVALEAVEVEADPQEPRLARIRILFRLIAAQASRAGAPESLELTLSLEG
jgi:phage baseplate assembly protein W